MFVLPKKEILGSSVKNRTKLTSHCHNRIPWGFISCWTARSRRSPPITLLKKARFKGYSMFPASTSMIRVTIQALHLSLPMLPEKKMSRHLDAILSGWRRGSPSTAPNRTLRRRGTRDLTRWYSTKPPATAKRSLRHQTIRLGF